MILCLFGGLIGWLVGWLVGWLAGWLAGWLVGWLVGSMAHQHWLWHTAGNKMTLGVKTTSPAGANRCIEFNIWNILSRLLRTRLDKWLLQFWCLHTPTTRRILYIAKNKNWAKLNCSNNNNLFSTWWKR